MRNRFLSEVLLDWDAIEVDKTYLYRKKELQTNFDIDWYDYGARMYDAAIARWATGLDPLAENYYSQSPYHFSGNNPITLVDDNGMNYTDFLNSETGESFYVNDGMNQVVEVDNETYNDVSRLVFHGDMVGWNQNMSDAYFSAIENGTKRPDLFSTINNVIEGQRFIGINDPALGNDIGICNEAARKQVNNAGYQPGWVNGGIHILTNDEYQINNGGSLLSTNPSMAINTINKNLEQGAPVMVGLATIAIDDGELLLGDTRNTNKLVQHFSVVVGRGFDKNGNYLSYWDNGYRPNTDIKVNRYYQKSTYTRGALLN